MKKTFKKTDEEFQIFNEFWNLTQEFYEPEPTDDYWRDFLIATIEFEGKHKDNLLCERMIIMLLEYLEKKYKGPKNKTIAYIKLLTQVRHAYKDFVKDADTEDIKRLSEILGDNKDTTEGKLLHAALSINGGI